MICSTLLTYCPFCQMRVLFLLVLYGALCGASSDSNQENIETLTDNGCQSFCTCVCVVLVLRVPDVQSSTVNVPLTCGEAYRDQPVIWKKNGKLIQALQGNQVEVQVEEMNGGNFTCHSPNGEYLNHTVILVQLDPDNRNVILKEKSPEEGYIDCSAPNYKGSFHCTWTRTSSRSDATVLLVRAERNMEKIPCQLDADGSKVLCHDANCPYKEEQHRISLTVYIYSSARLEAYTKSFYLREIVRPEELPLSSDGKSFSWDYPDSWEKPCTFFGLQFQVKVVQHGHSCDSSQEIMKNITEATKYEINVKTRRYVFCVRAQDKYTSGPFSPWSKCIDSF
ncbi:hypothetical protein L3Q82_022394 [Scortum barcoo]|uniref:Uncharacterized protein n=1 Tax=Scortum barcoo TaxID=214431 RepID=A0ACB8X0Q6_9TELE|nr:hypothetical protein L3Q82_022394 [Scortum barcoo]